MDKVQIYKQNQKKSKILSNIAPFVFWVLLILSIVCFILAIRNSIGNILEITNLLDTKIYNGAELQEHYSALVGKYGEWIIGNGGSGWTITFINVGRAVFNGFMITNSVMSILFYLSAFILGKWLLPKISKQILQENQDMVNLTILENSKNKK